MSDDNVATLKKKDGIPMLEVIIGYANFGEYDLNYYQNSKLLKSVKGYSGDNEPDIFKDDFFGNNLDEINGNIMTWTITMIDKKSKYYYAEVKITQSGQVIKSCKYEGELVDGVERKSDFLRLSVI